MKLPSRSAFKKVAIISTIVFVVSLVIMLRRLLGIYGCAGQNTLSGACSDLGTVGLIVQIASCTQLVAFLTAIIAVMGMAITKRKNNNEQS